jgi:putative flippase GtrA
MLRRHAAHFAFIGGVAFLFDAATYLLSGILFLRLLGQPVPSVQKVIGFGAGVLTTYLYNSRITFSISYSWGRFWVYLGSQLLGMVVNLSVFLLLRRFIPVVPALAGATLIAALVNFFGARHALRAK